MSDPLTEGEMSAIAGIDRNNRLIKGQVFLWKAGPVLGGSFGTSTASLWAEVELAHKPSAHVADHGLLNP